MKTMLVTTIALSTAAAGCFGWNEDKPLFGESTHGELENAWFQANSSFGCTFLDGCRLDRPLMLGVEERIAVRIDDPEQNDPHGTLTFDTSDASVVSLSEGALTS